MAEVGAARGDENARVIVEQAERLNRIVTDLLDYSRLRAEAFPVHAESNTADDLIGAAIRQCGALAAKTPIETDIEYDRPAPIGNFDFVQSLRILVNLLDNALRYAPPGTPVTVRVRSEGAELVLTVEDRGPGVPTEDSERIFEPFFRSGGQPSRQGGAGLGLSIARRLAEVQSGSLQYAPRLGGGSVFTLRLPALSAPEPVGEPDLAES
jgi:two-component system sensor histidine kinase KdpD